MDPDAALGLLLAETVMLRAAIDSADRDVTVRSLHAIASQAEDLAGWITNGGFLPAPAS